MPSCDTCYDNNNIVDGGVSRDFCAQRVMGIIRPFESNIYGVAAFVVFPRRRLISFTLYNMNFIIYRADRRPMQANSAVDLKCESATMTAACNIIDDENYYPSKGRMPPVVICT